MKKILDNDYYDLVVFNISIPEGYGEEDTVTSMGIRNSLLHVSKSNMEPCDLGDYLYFNFPKIFTPEASVSIEKSGIGVVRGNPFLNLLGSGIVIGIIDTGIDYQHMAFRNKDGSTRILSIWDQTIQGDVPPEGFTYGAEYSREQINLALQSDDPLLIVPSTDTNGHGTAIASIVAGSTNSEESFYGVVPESELIIVKLKEAKQNLKDLFFISKDAYCFQESDIVIGVNYLIAIFEKVNKPMVICLAMGTSQGAHNGRGLISGYFDALAQYSGMGVCVSAGNEGNKRRHYFNNTKFEPYYHDIELKVGEKDKQFWMEIWPYASGLLSIDVSSPNRESTQMIYPELGQCRKYQFIFTDTTIWVNNIIIEEGSNSQLILIRFNNPSAGIWHFRVANLFEEAFSFHCWLPSGNLISNETYFINSDPDSTITSPGNGVHQMTATAYNPFNDSRMQEASRGYTSKGLVKPDIAAPGYQIPCAVPGNQYGTATGTGAAAAHTAGAIAMVMEWAITKGNYPSITGYDINRMIMRGANRSIQERYPNNIWGYGQLDISSLFRVITNV